MKHSPTDFAGTTHARADRSATAPLSFRPGEQEDRAGISSSTEVPPHGALGKFLADFPVRTVSRGEFLFRQGQEAETFPFLQHGIVEREMSLAGDRRVVLDFLMPGTFIDLQPPSPGAVHTFTARALSRVRVITPDLAALAREIGHNGPLFLDLTARIAAEAESLVEAISEFKANSLRQRLAAFILSLCETQGRTAIELPVAKQDLARLLDTPPPGLSRAFADLEAIGIRSNRKTIIVTDIERVRAFCHDR